MLMAVLKQAQSQCAVLTTVFAQACQLHEWLCSIACLCMPSIILAQQVDLFKTCCTAVCLLAQGLSCSTT